MAITDLRALTALRRLRHVETDEARRFIGEALVQETALLERDSVIGRELDQARQIYGDFDRETFTAWLGRMWSERARLAVAVREAEARTATARAELTRRRLAETTAEEALARAVTALRIEVERRDQVMLEDVARALKRAATTHDSPPKVTHSSDLG